MADHGKGEKEASYSCYKLPDQLHNGGAAIACRTTDHTLGEPVMKSTEVQTLGELRMHGTSN